MSAFINSMMMVGVIFAVTAQCSIINSYDESNENYYYAGVSLYTPSRECASLGGLCVHENDCAQGQFTQKTGLCEDHDIGVECCYQVVEREAPCAQFGGVCMENCGVTIPQSLANDCGADKFCCILV